MGAWAGTREGWAKWVLVQGSDGQGKGWVRRGCGGVGGGEVVGGWYRGGCGWGDGWVYHRTHLSLKMLISLSSPS